MEFTKNKMSGGIPTDKTLPIVVKKQYTKEEAEICVMDDDCVLCLQLHKMTSACVINCGHEFGRECLAKWKRDTCPLCQVVITDIVEFDAPPVEEPIVVGKYMTYYSEESIQRYCAATGKTSFDGGYMSWATSENAKVAKAAIAADASSPIWRGLSTF